jgi:hypothetical protein
MPRKKPLVVIPKKTTRTKTRTTKSAAVRKRRRTTDMADIIDFTTAGSRQAQERIDVQELLEAWQTIVGVCRRAGVADDVVNLGCLTHVALIVVEGKRRGEVHVEVRACDDLVSLVHLLESEASEIVIPPKILGPNGEHLA